MDERGKGPRDRYNYFQPGLFRIACTTVMKQWPEHSRPLSFSSVRLPPNHTCLLQSHEDLNSGRGSTSGCRQASNTAIKLKELIPVAGWTWGFVTDGYRLKRSGIPAMIELIGFAVRGLRSKKAWRFDTEVLVSITETDGLVFLSGPPPPTTYRPERAISFTHTLADRVLYPLLHVTRHPALTSVLCSSSTNTNSSVRTNRSCSCGIGITAGIRCRATSYLVRPLLSSVPRLEVVDFLLGFCRADLRTSGCLGFAYIPPSP